MIDLLGRLRGTGAWQQIATEAGIDYMTLSRIYRGGLPDADVKGIKSPGVLVFERIVDAARKHELRLKRERRHANA